MAQCLFEFPAKSAIYFLCPKKTCKFFPDHLTPSCRCPPTPNWGFSNSPWCLLLSHCLYIHLGLLLWVHERAKLGRLEMKIRKKCPKWAIYAKPKIFKNPPKIQFWSDFKMPIVKNYQNIKSFQMNKVKLVWPQFTNSPDLYGEFGNCGLTNLI